MIWKNLYLRTIDKNIAHLEIKMCDLEGKNCISKIDLSVNNSLINDEKIRYEYLKLENGILKSNLDQTLYVFNGFEFSEDQNTLEETLDNYILRDKTNSNYINFIELYNNNVDDGFKLVDGEKC